MELFPKLEKIVDEKENEIREETETKLDNGPFKIVMNFIVENKL